MGRIDAAFSLGFIVGPAFGGVPAGNDPAAADFQQIAFAAAGTGAPQVKQAGHALRFGCADTRHTRLHYRRAPGRSIDVVLLHCAPATGRMYDTLARMAALATRLLALTIAPEASRAAYPRGLSANPRAREG